MRWTLKSLAHLLTCNENPVNSIKNAKCTSPLERLIVGMLITVKNPYLTLSEKPM